MIRRVQRFDAGELAKPERTAEGFLRVEGVIARPAILEYKNTDGSPRHELVTPETLFDPESMHSFSGLALTNDHPKAGLITPDTVAAHIVGTVGEPRNDGEQLVTSLGILTAPAIAAVEGGRSQLSCGYTAELEETPGVSDSLKCPECGTQKYDAIQRNRRGNHVAIVDKARAGDGAAMRLDAAGNATLATFTEPIYAATHKPNAALQQAEKPMAIRIDGNNYEATDPALQGAIDRVIAQVRTDAATAIGAQATLIDKMATIATRVKGHAIQRGAIARHLTAKLDAMKAKMIGCDECAGTGKVDSPDAEPGAPQVKCDYCGGTGRVRMHDAIKAAPADGGSPDGDDDDDDRGGPPMAEDDAMETSDPISTTDSPYYKTKKGKTVKSGGEAENRAIHWNHGKGLDAHSDAQKRRADSVERMIGRAAKSRAALIVEAQRHIGADAKLDGKTAAEIKRAVVAKLAPHMDAAKLDEGAIAVLYASEIARASSGQVSPSAQLSTAMFPGANGRTDGATVEWKKKVAAANHAMYPHAFPKPA